MPTPLVSVNHPDLKGAENKLRRAQEDFAALEGEVATFWREHPEPVRFGFRQDASPDLIPIVVESVDFPDPYLGTILGDVLHNFRSVLDHIAWQFVEHGRTPSSKLAEEAQVKVAFPIVLKPKSRRSVEEYFDSVCDSNSLPGVEPGHKAVVRLHQPYTRGNLAEGHPLAVLQELSNTDKHRTVHPVVWAPVTLGFKSEPPAGCEVKGFKLGPDVGQPFRVGAEVGYFTMTDKTLCNELEVKPNVEIQVTLENGEPLMAKLDWIEREVSDVLRDSDKVL
jgi:hypothetical protein